MSNQRNAIQPLQMMSEDFIERFLDLHYPLPPSSSSFAPSCQPHQIHSIPSFLLPAFQPFPRSNMTSVSPSPSSASLAPSLPMTDDGMGGMDPTSARATNQLLTSHLGSTKKASRGSVGKRRSFADDSQFSSRVYHLDPIPARSITPTYASQPDFPPYHHPHLYYAQSTHPHFAPAPYTSQHYSHSDHPGPSSYEEGGSLDHQHSSSYLHRGYSASSQHCPQFQYSKSSYPRSYPSHQVDSHLPYFNEASSVASSSNVHSKSHHFHPTSSPVASQNEHTSSRSSTQHAKVSSSPAISTANSGRKTSTSKSKAKTTPKKDATTPTRTYTKKSAYWEARKLGLGPQSSGRKKEQQEQASPQQQQQHPTQIEPSPVTITNDPTCLRAPINSPKPFLQPLPLSAGGGGELAKLRESWKAEQVGKEKKRPGWLKRTRKDKGRDERTLKGGVEILQPKEEGQGRMLDLWQTRTPGSASKTTPPARWTPLSPKRLSPNVRSSTKKNKPLPRTVSAPCLRTAANGKAALFSGQILASEYDSLVTRFSPRQPTPSSIPSVHSEPPSTSSQTPASQRSEKRRRRLAPFSDELDENSDANFFASPITERTKANDLNSKRGLVAARVLGVGRMIFGKDSVEELVEGGTVTLDDDAISGEGGREKGEGLVLMVQRIKPDWPDREFPWRVGGEEQKRERKAETRQLLGKVEKYLDSSDGEKVEENGFASGDHARSQPSIFPSVDVTLPSKQTSYPSRGGKSSGPLFSRLPSRPSSSSAATPFLSPNTFDPSDARHVLLFKHQTLRCSTANRLSLYPHPFPQHSLHDDASTDCSLSADEDDQSGIVLSSRQQQDDVTYVGCFCRGGVSGAEGGSLVECTLCKTWHHAACIGLAEGASLGIDWCCWKCGPEEGGSSSQATTGCSMGGFEESDVRTPTIVHSTPVLVQSEMFDSASSLPGPPGGEEEEATSGRRGDRTPPRSTSTLALAPSPLFSGGRTFSGAIPIQRGFSAYSPLPHTSSPITPRTPSSTSALRRYTAVPLSPSLQRSHSSNDDSTGATTSLSFGTPSRRAPTTPHHASSSIPRTPTSTFLSSSTSKHRSSHLRTPGGGQPHHAEELNDYPQTIFDLSSTPSRHLSHSREYPFGGTPISSARSGSGSDRQTPSPAVSNARFRSGLHSLPPSPPKKEAAPHMPSSPTAFVSSGPSSVSRPKPIGTGIAFTTPSQTQSFFAGLRSPSVPPLPTNMTNVDDDAAEVEDGLIDDDDDDHHTRTLPELFHSFLPSSADSHGPISPYLSHPNTANTPTQPSSSSSTHPTVALRSSSLTSVASAPVSTEAPNERPGPLRRSTRSSAGGRLAMATRPGMGGASAAAKGKGREIGGMGEGEDEGGLMLGEAFGDHEP